MAPQSDFEKLIQEEITTDEIDFVIAFAERLGEKTGKPPSLFFCQEQKLIESSQVVRWGSFEKAYVAHMAWYLNLGTLIAIRRNFHRTGDAQQTTDLFTQSLESSLWGCAEDNPNYVADRNKRAADIMDELLRDKYAFILRDGTWNITFESKTIRFPEKRHLGLSYIQYLLKNESKDIRATEIVSNSETSAGSLGSSFAEPKKLTEELRNELTSCSKNRGEITRPQVDSELLAQHALEGCSREETERLLAVVREEIESTTDAFRICDLRGREKTLLRSLRERWQKRKDLNVRKAVKRAMVAVKECDEPLATFLSNHLKIGFNCRYTPPETGLHWKFS